jgi:S-formylglutathione hydrolase FrmB
MRMQTVRTAVMTALLCSGASAAWAQADIQTVEFFSESVGRTTRYNIVLPRTYDDSDRRYPVLYLLHGLSQNYQAWSRQGVRFYAPFFDMIVVMPDAGNSWYVNWAARGGGQRNDWEDHIVRDVIGHVDASYRTVARREGRAINGLSMGGYGGLTLGLRHPDLFISIGSHSGALEYGRGHMERIRRDAQPRRETPASPAEETVREARRRRPNPEIGIEGFSSQIERTPLGQPFVTAEDARRYDPFTLIRQVPPDQLPHIYVDCGTEDGLIDSTKAFIQIMLDHDIPFDFMQMPGGHDPGYWTQAIGHSMSVQYEVIQRALGRRPVAIRR